jgi:hypothetical protein
MLAGSAIRRWWLMSRGDATTKGFTNFRTRIHALEF